MTQSTPPTLMCCCLRLTREEIDQVIRGGARSVDEVADACGAGTGCGACRFEVKLRCDELSRRGELKI